MKRNSNSNEPEFKRGLTEDEINSPEFNPDDFAPAPDTEKACRENEALENKRNALVFAFVTAFFAIIIGLCGWASTKSVMAYNEKVFENNVLSMYANCDSMEEYKTDHEGFVVNAVFYKNKMAGYCVSTTVKGFGGDIDMVVAFNSKNEISEIKILDHNESKGLGSKIAGDKFLSQFMGLLIGNSSNEFDMIAGATISSKAVCDAIEEILALGLSTDSIANELGYETISAEEIEKETEKDEDNKDKNNNKKPSSSQKPSDTTSDRNNSGLGGYQGGQNSNNGGDNIGVDGEDVTTVYETETKRPDEEETTGPEETTKEPEETTGKPAETTGKPETTSPPVDTKPDTTVAVTTEEPKDTEQDTTKPPEETTAPPVTEPPATTAPDDTGNVPGDPINPAGGDN